MKAETFAQARARLFSRLRASGWSVTERSYLTMKNLKVPYAVKGRVKLWFKTQSIHISDNGLALNDARSLVSDIRNLTSSDLERYVRHYYPGF